MRIIFAEYIKDYSTYTFSYVPYAVHQNRNAMEEIYEAGFLPYTGNIHLDHFLYYKARSVRIDLHKFEMGSENRRVARKFESHEVAVKWFPIEDFDTGKDNFMEFCIEYSRQRFKGGEMAYDRLEYVLQSPYVTDIVQFDVDDRRAGYVFVVRSGIMMHYWYSFYELNDFQDLPLGKYMMMEMIQQSKEKNLKYCYLGTCYGAHSLYKVRDFKGVEFSDGSLWSSDIKQLKVWCKNEDTDMDTDRFKYMSPVEANDYISSILDSSKS